LAACNQYLDAHFDAVLTPGQPPINQASYKPGLDGKPVAISDVVHALLPLTLAGSLSKDGKDQMFQDTVSQLVDLVSGRFTSLAVSKSAAALEAATKRGVAQTVAASSEAEDWVKNYLQSHGLASNVADASGATVMFDNKSAPLDTVVNKTVADGKKANLKSGDEGRGYITPDLVRKIIADILVAAIPRVPGPRSGSGKPQRVSAYLQYTFTPTTVHTPASGGKDSQDQPAHSLTGQLTMEFHADNQSGLEISSFGQLTWFADEKGGHITNQSGFAGAQVAWVWSFLDGNLQAGPFFQALVGASKAQQKLSNKLEWTPTGQVGAGGQVQYAIPGFKGHLLVGVQAGVSATDPKGGDPTTDRSVGFTLTYKF
jgi:hypothetical protein